MQNPNDCLLIENSTLLASVAPGKYYESSVVCFQDSCFLILKKISSTFRVDGDPTVMYNFGADSVPEGLKKVIDSCQTVEELKSRLTELINGNQTCILNFSDYKKTTLKGFLGQKTFSARQSALKYISFTVKKEDGKKLAEFYPNI